MLLLLLAHGASSSRSGAPRLSAMAKDIRLLIDFTDPKTALDFIPVDDRIMGGQTVSRVVHEDGCTCFKGVLVVEGGGFASVRCTEPLSLASDVDALVLEACADGRRGYKLTLTSIAAPQGVSYQYVLPLDDVVHGEFVPVRCPLSSFRPSFRGRPAPEAPPLRAEDVRSLGLMLSRYEGDGEVKVSINPGPFKLRLRKLAVGESELAINGKRWV